MRTFGRTINNLQFVLIRCIIGCISCVTKKSIGLSDFCITPASFVEDAIVKLDWLNENEVNFFLKCNTEHKKYEKIQKLSLELEDKKVKS